MKSQYVWTLAATLAAALVGADRAGARNYTVEMLPIPAGLSAALPSSVNDNGDVVGLGVMENKAVCVLWSHGTTRILSGAAAPGGGNYQFNPYKINIFGDIIGGIGFVPQIYDAKTDQVSILPGVSNVLFIKPVDLNDNGIGVGYAEGERYDALYWRDGQMRVLPPLTYASKPFAEAFAVNNWNQMVGFSYGADGRPHGVLWQNAQPSEFAPNPAPGEGQAIDINDNGQVLYNGQFLTDANTYAGRAFVGNGAGWTDIGKLYPSDDFVGGLEINNKKWCIGFEEGSAQPYTPLLWKNGQMVNLYSLLPAGSSVNLASLRAINNKDQIIASGLYPTAVSGYLLTPEFAGPPVISGAAPASVPRGEANATLTITGSGFEDDTTVFLKNGVELPTHVLSANKLTVDLPASATSQLSRLDFRLYTPPAGGGYSKFMSVTVVARPILTSIAPARVDPGSAKTPTYFTGMNFASGDLVTVTDQSNHTYVVVANVASDTKLAIYLPDAVRAAAGLYYLRVGDPSGRILSNPALLTVGRAAPVIGSLNPNHISVGQASLSLNINGTGIVAGSKVSFSSGTPVTPSSIQQNRLVVSVPSAVLARLGTYQVRIVNTVADGGVSAPMNFTVTAK